VSLPETDRDKSAFLNVPYDPRYSKLFLAFIAGLSAYGLTPRATLEIPSGQRRLDRVLEMLQRCRYSFHDLSRIQLDRNHPVAPRFNMPFELGLTVALHRVKQPDHQWFVFESVPHRLNKSLSDLDGTDPHVHGGTVRGVFRELTNALVGSRYQPTVGDMNRIYRELSIAAPRIMRDAGTDSLLSARVFRDLAVVGSRLWSKAL
jgi:hypothetical protein